MKGATRKVLISFTLVLIVLGAMSSGCVDKSGPRITEITDEDRLDKTEITQIFDKDAGVLIYYGYGSGIGAVQIMNPEITLENLPPIQKLSDSIRRVVIEEYNIVIYRFIPGGTYFSNDIAVVKIVDMDIE